MVAAAISNTSPVERAVLIAADTQDGWPAEDSLEELTRLAETAGAQVVGTVVQNVQQPHSASYLGRGKIRELRDQKSSLRFDSVIADDELSPAQQRYLEASLDVHILDRTAVILDIFAHHARTREGRLQVELAQYRYLLPRLTGKGVELSRLGGGINTRGPGETKLESDRRRIRKRISDLNKEIEQVRRQRSGQRQQRRESGVPVVALAGYTNAGKSTLLNSLTGANVLSSNQLFATLDPTTRRVELADGQEILLTDTVGFIQKLPTDLVAAFRATLEEITEANVIVHVVDASHPQVEEQVEAVEDELEDLGVADKPRVTLLNKVDLVTEQRLERLQAYFPGSTAISATTGYGREELEQRLLQIIASRFVPVEVEIPYDKTSLISLFRSRGVIERETHLESGTRITGGVPAALLPSFQEFQTKRTSTRLGRRPSNQSQ